MDYCNAILAGASKSTTADARIVSDTRKNDRGLTDLLHDELHWLDVPERVQYKLCSTVHRCLQHKVPQYMKDFCIHTSDIARRQHMRSAGCRQLLVPRHGWRCYDNNANRSDKLAFVSDIAVLC